MLKLKVESDYSWADGGGSDNVSSVAPTTKGTRNPEPQGEVSKALAR